MATKIEITQAAEGLFEVRLIEAASQTSHRVTVKQDDYSRLTQGGITAEELVRRSFEFLLDREPKESILAEFDLSVIRRYFPDFDREITRRLSQPHST